MFRAQCLRKRVFHNGTSQTFTHRYRKVNGAKHYSPLPSFAEAVGKPPVFRPILVSLVRVYPWSVAWGWLVTQIAFGTCTVIYFGAAKLTNVDTKFWTEKLGSAPTWKWNATTNTNVSSGEMKRARLFSIVEVCEHLSMNLYHALAQLVIGCKA